MVVRASAAQVSVVFASNRRGGAQNVEVDLSRGPWLRADAGVDEERIGPTITSPSSNAKRSAPRGSSSTVARWCVAGTNAPLRRHDAGDGGVVAAEHLACDGFAHPSSST